MADKINAIKIKQPNGSYSDQIPISVLVQNVQWDQNHSLLDALGSVDLSSSGKGNLQHQIDELDEDKISHDDFNSQLDEFLSEQIKEDTETWLEENINPGEGFGITTNLTLSGWAADAKAVGDAINAKTFPIDSTLSDSSTNPVQNKVVTSAISELNGSLDDLSDTVDSLSIGLSPEQQSILISLLRRTIYDENLIELVDALENTFNDIVHITRIAFSNSSLSITGVSPVTVGYSVTPSHGTDPIIWLSSDESVVTVKNGVVTPKKNGSAVITAHTTDGITETLPVSVNISTACYTVKNNLTRAENSNPVALVVKNNSYEGTITANRGYYITDVNVTMGGTDVTSMVVNESSINIQTVTGDIVITATTAPDAVTPLYRGENLVFDGTANTVIDTGVKLCDTDKNVTIIVEFDTPISNYRAGTILSAKAGTTGKDGYSVVLSGNNCAIGAYANATSVPFNDTFNQLSGKTQVAVFRHMAGTGTGQIMEKTQSDGRVGTKNVSFTFEAHEQTVILGGNQWNGLNGFLRGTIRLVEIYDKYLTDDEIAKYYN